jgi:hypothetical protein
MRIGSDFEKIEWNPGGIRLLEPNAMIGDLFILGVALFFFLRISPKDAFFSHWKKFYFFMGLSFFMGGIGHLLFHYTGLWGKAPSWLIGMFAIYSVEQAMLTKWEGNTAMWKTISKWKLVLFIAAEIGFLLSFKPNMDPALGLLLPTLNSLLGLGLSLGFLGAYFHKHCDANYKFFWIGALILLPNAVIQGLKINIHPWFDRNDFSHVLIIVGMITYYQGISKLSFQKQLIPESIENN